MLLSEKAKLSDELSGVNKLLLLVSKTEVLVPLSIEMDDRLLTYIYSYIE